MFYNVAKVQNIGECIIFTAEKAKAGISSIFNYVVVQLNEAWHHDDITKT